MNEYIEELNTEYPDLSSVRLTATYPLDGKCITSLFESHDTLLIIEELEPFLEMMIRSLASTEGWAGKIIGKMDRVLPRTGRYSIGEIRKGITAARGKSSITPEADETAYTYDSHGNVLTVTDGSGVTTTYEYDRLHRKVGQSDELGRPAEYRRDNPLADNRLGDAGNAGGGNGTAIALSVLVNREEDT